MTNVTHSVTPREQSKYCFNGSWSDVLHRYLSESSCDFSVIHRMVLSGSLAGLINWVIPWVSNWVLVTVIKWAIDLRWASMILFSESFSDPLNNALHDELRDGFNEAVIESVREQPNYCCGDSCIDEWLPFLSEFLCESLSHLWTDYWSDHLGGFRSVWGDLPPENPAQWQEIHVFPRRPNKTQCWARVQGIKDSLYESLN